MTSRSAVEKLISHGRPYAAISCLHKMQYDRQPLEGSQVARALLAARRSSETLQTKDVYEIVEIIKELQNNLGPNRDYLFQIEWAYMPILDRHHEASPKLLEHLLATDPKFFCELIRTIFRSKKQEPPIKLGLIRWLVSHIRSFFNLKTREKTTEPATELRRNFASNAYLLLSQWETPPGCREDGSFSGEALAAWLDAVTKECAETGHLEVAMTMVGQVLMHAPADPDGLWIDRSAAAALNARDAGNMRSGFHTALINSRGVYGFTAGEAERTLATRYREQADEVENAGYRRLATTLREVAEFYDHQAERDSSRDPFDD